MIDRSELFRHFNAAKSYAALLTLAEDFGNAIEAGDLRVESSGDIRRRLHHAIRSEASQDIAGDRFLKVVEFLDIKVLDKSRTGQLAWVHQQSDFETTESLRLPGTTAAMTAARNCV